MDAAATGLGSLEADRHMTRGLTPLSTQLAAPRSGCLDQDLIELAQGGDARAFEILVDRHAQAAFSLAYRMCGRRSLAEDIAQDAFLSLWRSLSRYDRHRGSVRSLLLSTVHNRAIDAFRRESLREVKTVPDDDSGRLVEEPVCTADEVERRDEAKQIRVALSALPIGQRQVIELAYFDGLSQSAIAERMGLPIGTVKGRARLGLSKLRDVMSDPLRGQ
jgi:RNA polymerase sigma-70 factor (ECF subfamily)